MQYTNRVSRDPGLGFPKRETIRDCNFDNVSNTSKKQRINCSPQFSLPASNVGPGMLACPTDWNNKVSFPLKCTLHCRNFVEIYWIDHLPFQSSSSLIFCFFFFQFSAAILCHLMDAWC